MDSKPVMGHNAMEVKHTRHFFCLRRPTSDLTEADASVALGMLARRFVNTNSLLLRSSGGVLAKDVSQIMVAYRWLMSLFPVA